MYNIHRDLTIRLASSDGRSGRILVIWAAGMVGSM
jgi:hypothetical protein